MTSQSDFRPDLLSGRVALVTGGSSGIGYEITRQLALHGATVCIMGRRKEQLHQAQHAMIADGAVTESRCAALQGDVRSPDDAKRVIGEITQRFGALDILVNCAAGNFLVAAENLSTNGFRTVMEIDAIGTFNMSRAAFEPLRASKFQGNIINISATLHCYATWYQAS